MNGFDYVVIAITVAGALYGLKQGLLRMLTSVAALAAGVYVASVYYGPIGEIAARQLAVNLRIGAVIGWLAVFIVMFAAVEIVGSSAIHVLHIVHLSWADRLAGSLLGAGAATVAAGLTVMLLAAVLPVDAALLRDSQLAPLLIAYNNALVRYIPQEAKSAYETNRDNLMHNWLVQEAQRTIARPGASPAASPSPAAK
jgi:uncharacterized membrane protein required for colicin V production